MSRLSNPPNQSKESREAKRTRLANMERAKEDTKKIILPLIIVFFTVIIFLFFYRFGLGLPKIPAKVPDL